MAQQRWLACIMGVVLIIAAGMLADAAEQVTLLIHPTLFKAAGGQAGVVGDFEKATGIKVVVVTSPYSKIKDKAMLAFAAGGGQFDVVTLVGPWINEETIGFLQPLAEFVARAPADYDFDDLIPSLVDESRFPKPDGPNYGIPYRVGTGMGYYRTDLFAKAGISPPTSWSDFLTAAQKLYTPGKVYGVVQRGKPGVHVEQDFLRYLHSTGHGVLSADAKTCLLDRPDAIRMLEIFGTPFLQGWAPPDMLAWGREEYINAMAQGRAAMGIYFSPYWGRMTNPKASKVADRIGWFLVPSLRGERPGATLNGAWHLAMDKNSQHKEAAWKLIMALTNKQNQLRGALEWANGPVRTSVYDNSGFKEKFPVAKAWLTAIARSTGAAQHPRAAEISDITSKEVINYLQQKKSAKQAMTDACRQINNYL